MKITLEGSDMSSQSVPLAVRYNREYRWIELSTRGGAIIATLPDGSNQFRFDELADSDCLQPDHVSWQSRIEACGMRPIDARMIVMMPDQDGASKP